MPSFKFYLDRKCTVWIREVHEFESTTEEEAKAKILKLYKDDELFNQDTFLEEEVLFDTIDYLTPEDNENFPTEELSDEDLKIIASNEKPN